MTEHNEYAIMEPKLRIGFDKVLKYVYRKGKRTYTKKIVRVCDGTVFVLDPATKNQCIVGEALMVDGVLILALPVHRESY